MQNESTISYKNEQIKVTKGYFSSPRNYFEGVLEMVMVVVVVVVVVGVGVGVGGRGGC